MLPTTHNRAYQDFITLLTKFSNFVQNSLELADKSAIKQEFFSLKQWFEVNIDNLNDREIEAAYIPRWQSIQREIKREFRLLTTDILFLASARQSATKTKRLTAISDHLNKITSYCQGIIAENNGKE